MPEIVSLLNPIRVGRVDIKNRLVLAPLSMYLADNCRVSQRLINFYTERARGGVGLIICTFAALRLAEGGPWKDYIPSIYDDGHIPEIKKLVKSIHDNGAKAAIQLYSTADWPGGDSVGPSAVPVLRRHLPPIIPRELSMKEIRKTICEIGEACRRSRDAGFDMVEFHAMGGDCFISRFLAAVTNSRTDHYGGSAKNRLNVLLEILEKSKQMAGTDFTFMVRISGEGFRDGTPTLEEQKSAAVILETAGFDAIDVTPGWRGQTISTIDQPEGAFSYLAYEIKKKVTVPIITGTRYVDPFIADRVISEGKADMVSMGRALIADPELINKITANKIREIRPCTSCQRCAKRTSEGKSIECSVNLEVGREGIAKCMEHSLDVDISRGRTIV